MGLALLFTLLAIGVAGYILIEGWSFLDSFYMTVLTFTTVGFHEVHSLSDTGRMFTIFLMVAGVGAMLYFLSSLMQAIVEHEALRSFVRRRRMRTRLAGERNHYILCGFGRVGKEVAVAFQREDADFIIIDPDSHAIAEANELGYAYVQGDATQDDVLESAGIARARGLVASTGNDSHNVFIALSAKGLNSDLFIVARTSDDRNAEKLRRAGADQVISPHAIGGRRIAMSAVRPLAVDFMDSFFDGVDHNTLRFTVIHVDADSPLVGSTVSRSATRLGIEVLALRRGESNTRVGPGSDDTIRAGDDLLVVGPGDRLEALESGE